MADWNVPQDAITGTLANAKFIAIGRQFEGDFCVVSPVTGKVQNMVAVYSGSDPAALTVFIKDATGVSRGTRLVTITKAGAAECTDGNLGGIFKYTGTEE